MNVLNASGANVVYSKSPASSGLDLSITTTDNVAKIELTGPDQNSTKEQAQTAVPTTFTLYSDSAKTNEIYRFTISKWFIAKTGAPGGYSKIVTFCQNLGYRIPGVTDYTNSNGLGWTGGLSGQGNTYRRIIGGGLFAEWGAINYYTNSDFTGRYYWSDDSTSDGANKFAVFGNDGFINSFSLDYTLERASCVSQ